MHYNHILTIGTTGMLAEATIQLAQYANTLTCLAKTPHSLAQLHNRLRDSTTNFQAVPIDYQHTANFMREITHAWQSKPFDLVLVWMHRSGNTSLAALVAFLSKQTHPVKLSHVVGSAVADPNRKAKAHPFASTQSLTYQQIILGFQLEGAYTRWLTHKEISADVLQAIEEQKPTFVVGTVTPWSKRP